MLRSILSVVAGAAVWAVLWLGGNQALIAAFPQHLQPEQPITHVGTLLAILLFSVVLSVLAGYVTAVVAKHGPIAHALALGVLQLLIGIFVQLSYWDLMPLWYHLPFLLLIVPSTALGGWLRAVRTA